jgi:molybdate transport system permease protein
MDYTALYISLKLALISSAFVLCLSIPLAWWLSRSKSKLKPFLEAFFCMPIVLPPTVIGFYLLLFLGVNGPLYKLGFENIIFSFTALVIGSVFYTFPFVLTPLQNTFNAVDQIYLDMAANLGANKFKRFISIVLPMSKKGIISAALLGFAHTLGEFGVVLMLGGNIAGKTQVVSISIYDQVESLNYSSAHKMSLILIIFSFLILSTVKYIESARKH